MKPLKKRPLAITAIVNKASYSKDDIVEVYIDEHGQKAFAEIIAIDISPDNFSPFLLSFKHLLPHQIPDIENFDESSTTFSLKVVEDYEHTLSPEEFIPYLNHSYGWAHADNVIARFTELEFQIALLEYEVIAQP